MRQPTPDKEDTTPIKEPEEEQVIEGSIPAPPIDDVSELPFDWPSEEIKRACEDLFPGDKECKLPVLKWIVPEQKQQSQNWDGGIRMEDIQRS